MYHLIFIVLCISATFVSGIATNVNLVAQYCLRFNAYPDKFSTESMKSLDNVLSNDDGEKLFEIYVNDFGRDEDKDQMQLWCMLADPDFYKTHHVGDNKFNKIMSYVTDEDDPNECKETLEIQPNQCHQFKNPKIDKFTKVERLKAAVEENLESGEYSQFMRKVDADLSTAKQCP